MTDRPSIDPYTEADIQRVIGMLEVKFPWMIKRIELEIPADKTFEEWLRTLVAMEGTDATLPGEDSQTEYEKAADEFLSKYGYDGDTSEAHTRDRQEVVEDELFSLIQNQLLAHDRKIRCRFPVTVEIPEEVWKRARIKLKHLREPGKPIKTGDGRVRETLFKYMTPDYEWRVDGVPLTEMNVDDIDVEL